MAQPPAKKRRTTALVPNYREKPKWTNMPTPPPQPSPIKSGLTPLIVSAKPSGMSNAEIDQYNIDVGEQQYRLKGFSTAELQAMEAIAPYVADKLPLTVEPPIHPIFSKDRWCLGLHKHSGPYPIAGGKSGFWETNNPVVWAALKPALHLASRFMFQAHEFPWFDALLLGRTEAILDPTEFPPDPKKKSWNYAEITLRPAIERDKDGPDKIQEVLKDYVKSITYDFSSARTELFTGLPDTTGATYGITSGASRYDDAHVHIAIELLEPVMFLTLNDAERSLDTFRLAATLLHEFSHALASVKRKKFDSPWQNEMYFENERHAEMGFSAENALFGGTDGTFCKLLGMSGDDRSASCFAMFSDTWDNIWHTDYNGGRFPARIPLPDNYYHRKIWPIPVKYYFEVQNADYWKSQVAVFGCDAVKMGLKSIGMLHEVPKGTVGHPGHNGIVPTIRRQHNGANVMQLRILTGSMTEAEIAATKTENVRRLGTDRIVTALQARARLEMVMGYARPNSPRRYNSPFPVPRSPSTTPPPTPPKVRPLMRLPKPPRFAKIIDYLEKNYELCGLRYLTSPIPEHVLYDYIIRTGKLQMTPYKWRECLECADDHEEYFKYKRDGASTGTVWLRKEGWQNIRNITRSRPQAPKRIDPNAMEMSMFYSLSEEAFKSISLSVGKRQDIDLDVHYTRLSVRYLRRRDKAKIRINKGVRMHEFSRDLYNACLYQSYRDKGNFTYGGIGTIRIKANPEDLAKESEPKNKGDRCPTM